MTTAGDGSSAAGKAGAEVDERLAEVLRIARDNTHPGQFEAIRWLIRRAYETQAEDESIKQKQG